MSLPRSQFLQACSFLLALALLASATQTQQKLFRLEDSRVSMACAFTVVIYGEDQQQLPLIVKAVLDEADRIDNLMSNYKRHSPLSFINREAAKGPVEVEPELFDFLQECVRYSRESEGAFDITVGPLMKAWGFFRGEGRMPTASELNSMRAKIGYQHLILDAKRRTIQFNRPGMELDLGGIAKGYAVDRMVHVLKSYKIKRALISAGGSTLYGLGAPPDSEGWEVKIRDPISPGDPKKSAVTVLLKNRALSVSGGSEKFFQVGGVTYSHIMDPRAGWPAQNMLSVAVVTDSGTVGDALDNIFYVQGVEKSRAYLERFPGTEVFFFLPEADKRWKMVRLKF